ncbi:Crp/Fnr family transcriptional regulator [uncultured Mailhella sp.]|uniref:Crp/Fnr family transcriptional regulator n=1 Tax=uncultured Mailhella sp. TaxID=1981031 RepID=UPI00262BE04B|nr:Crp/Fnr family transcriptional regulator [uncultured Mailhella sp.]
MAEELWEQLQNRFQDLSAEGARALAAVSRFRIYSKGEWIFSEGVQLFSAYWLESGRVELIKGTLSGKGSILHVMCAGRFIDLCALFGGGTAFYSALALEQSRVLQIESAALLAELKANAALSLRLMRELAARQRMFINKISASQGKISVRRRVAGWLLHKARVEDSPVLKDDVTREVLAGLLGLSRESLCRQLGQFSRDGVIRLERKSIVITDAQALRRSLEE